MIREAKRESYRQFIDKAAQGNTLWRLARWSKGAGGGPSQVPLLKTKQGIANSHEAKVRALRDRFYPTP